MTENKIHNLLEAKRTELGYDGWTVDDVDIEGYNKDYTVYYVTYEEKSKDGYEQDLGVILQYKDGKWDFDLPGFSGTAEDPFKTYDLIRVDN